MKAYSLPAVPDGTPMQTLCTFSRLHAGREMTWRWQCSWCPWWGRDLSQLMLWSCGQP